MEAKTTEIMDYVRSGNATSEQKISALDASLTMPVMYSAEIITTLWEDPDQPVRDHAQKVVKDIPEENFANYILMEDITADRLMQLSKVFINKPSVLEAIILNPTTNDETIKYLAGKCESAQIELILLDKPRLSRVPSIIEVILGNPRLSSRLRSIITRERERSGDALFSGSTEAGGESRITSPRLLLTGKVAEGVDKAIRDVEAIDDEEEKSKSVFKQILAMSVPEKIQFALKGPKEARTYLIRDKNKVVAATVLKSPKVNEASVESFAKMRNVSDDILRMIASNRQWMRKMSIVENLAKNPKTPVPITLQLMPRLNRFVIKSLSTSRDVPDAVRKMAQRLTERMR
jgi:hypothetical protein